MKFMKLYGVWKCTGHILAINYGPLPFISKVCKLYYARPSYLLVYFQRIRFQILDGC